jgi:hypothetical protein
MMEPDDLAVADGISSNTNVPDTIYDPQTDPSATVNPTTIFDEAHECLAQSLLMFLYADLRLLSATGRINTKYETLCIASDRVPRTSAAGIAQLPGMNEFVNDDEIQSVSPAQIMAILIVELRQEVIAQRKRAKEQIKRRGERGWFEPKSESDEDIEEDDDAGVMNKIADSNGRKEFETDMHAMVRAYNDMLRKDLKGIPEVKMTFSNPFARENTPRKYTRQTLQAIKKFTDGLQGKHIDKADDGAKAKPAIRNAVSYDEYNRSNSDEAVHRRILSTPNKPKLENVFEDKSEDKSDEEESRDIFSTPTPQDDPHQRKQFASSDMKGYQSKLYDFLESVKGLKPSHQSQDEDAAEIMSDPGISSRDENSTRGMESTHAASSSKRPTITQQISVYIERAKEDHALYNKYLIPAEDYNTFTHAEDVGNAIFNGDMKMPSKKRLSAFDETYEVADDEDDDRNMNETELLDFMTKCINSRDDTKLSFMKDFFKEDCKCYVSIHCIPQALF